MRGDTLLLGGCAGRCAAWRGRARRWAQQAAVRLPGLSTTRVQPIATTGLRCWLSLARATGGQWPFWHGLPFEQVLACVAGCPPETAPYNLAMAVLRNLKAFTARVHAATHRQTTRDRITRSQR